jgi:hypothetical protein
MRYQDRKNVSNLFKAYSTMESYSRTISEETENGLEGRDRISFEVLSPHFPEGTEEN